MSEQSFHKKKKMLASTKLILSLSTLFFLLTIYFLTPYINKMDELKQYNKEEIHEFVIVNKMIQQSGRYGDKLWFICKSRKTGEIYNINVTPSSYVTSNKNDTVTFNISMHELSIDNRWVKRPVSYVYDMLFFVGSFIFLLFSITTIVNIGKDEMHNDIVKIGLSICIALCISMWVVWAYSLV